LVLAAEQCAQIEQAPVEADSSKHIPVPPTLAAMLAEWKLGGWAAMMGRHPEPNDLIVPMPPEHAARRRTRTGEAFRGHDYSASAGAETTSLRSDGGTAGTTTCGPPSSRWRWRMEPIST
jgi:hypothetical protein